MHHRRTHKKSKNGCRVCRKRKIKCDEVKPRCANCIRYEVPCSFDPGIPKSDEFNPYRSAVVPAKRGRGRPRKDWGRLEDQSFSPGGLASTSPCEKIPSPSNATSSLHLDAPVTCHSLNIPDIELLLHFTTHTAPSLAHPRDTAIALFWSHNVPRIGLSCHTVLHLVLALAGHHLAYTTVEDTGRSTRYASLAQMHSSLGLAELTRALASINNEVCGALYTAAVLVSYCTFAAGPADANDLLVCNVGSRGAALPRWISVVQGVRLIMQTFEPAVLFSGLVAPLYPRDKPASSTPTCVEDETPRVDWEEPMHRLRGLIISREEPNTAIYLKNYQQIEAIYEATYGKADGTFDCAVRNKFIFIWLYSMDDDFVACLQQRQPLSLLLLAYYALLLANMQRDWYIHGWPVHMLMRIREILQKDYLEWLDWPLEQVGHLTGLRRPGWLARIM
ncbi:hypothetical protein BJX63DRAFT_412569, partial [Aspergillus granulosus]